MTFTPLDEPLLAAGALALAALAVWKVVLPLARAGGRLGRRVTRAIDVLIGSPAIPDPDRPGEYLRPEVPDMGVRMTAVEGVLNEFVLRDLHANVQQTRQAADRAARDARRALKGVTDLRAASEVWHAKDFGVLTNIEQSVGATTENPKEGESDG